MTYKVKVSGVMGVPITFLDHYNPDQFDIIGKADSGPSSEYDLFKPTIGGVNTYKRLLIRRREIQ